MKTSVTQVLSVVFTALAVELSHHSAPVALGPLVIVWLSAFLRDRSTFLVVNKKPAPVSRHWPVATQTGRSQ